jgi:hypothetical protein
MGLSCFFVMRGRAGMRKVDYRAHFERKRPPLDDQARPRPGENPNDAPRQPTPAKRPGPPVMIFWLIKKFLSKKIARFSIFYPIKIVARFFKLLHYGREKLLH